MCFVTCTKLKFVQIKNFGDPAEGSRAVGTFFAAAGEPATVTGLGAPVGSPGLGGWTRDEVVNSVDLFAAVLESLSEKLFADVQTIFNEGVVWFTARPAELADLLIPVCVMRSINMGTVFLLAPTVIVDMDLRLYRNN